jgi:DNA-binding Lrp family transcriptional regulator
MDEEVVKLDKLDREILYILDTNSRTPASRIAKMLKTSKERVIYRINRLVSEKVIDKFLMVTNLAALGHSSYKVCVQLQKVSGAREEEIVKSLVAHPRVGFVARSEGKYDLVFALLARSPEDFNSQIGPFLSRFQVNIRDYDMAITLSGETFSRKYFLEEERRELTVATWGKGGKKPELDRVDVGILKSLGEDCRKSALEIAKEVDVSGDTVLKRMKRVEEGGIIQAYKVQLNKLRYGYRYHKLFLNMAFMKEKREAQVKAYFREHPYVVFAMRTLGKWNYELDVELPASEHFHKVMREMRDHLGEELMSYESIYCYEEPKFNYMAIDTEGLVR